MSEIRVGHPYLQILPRDTFALHADVVISGGEEADLVELRCDELDLHSTQAVNSGVPKDNSDEVRYTFDVSSFRSHSSYEQTRDERTFNIDAFVLCVDETGGEDIVAQTTFPLKMTML